MPPRKYTRRAKRPSLRKAKAMVTKVHKAKAKKNRDNFFYQARTQLLIKPVQGVTVANYIYQGFNLLDPGGAGGQGSWSIHNIPEFNLFRSIYDKVRVNSVTVRVVPRANVFSQDAAQNDGSLNLTGDGMIHTVVDRDNLGPSNIAQLRKYPSYKAYSVMKPFTRSYAIKYPTGVWLDTSTLANMYSDLPMLDRMGGFGGITLYAENLPEDNGEIFNEPWASVEIRYNCVFQGKTSSTVSWDPDTNSVTVTQELPAPNKPFSDTLLPGVDTVDNSGNLVRGNKNNQ